MYEREPFDPDKTNPSIDSEMLEELDKTKEFKLPQSQEDTAMEEMLDRVQRHDAKLMQEFSVAISGAMMGRRVRVLDITSLGDSKFDVTFEVAGETHHTVIKQQEPVENE